MKLECRTSQFLPHRLFAFALAIGLVFLSGRTFADVVSARYATGAEVPITADGFTATDKSVDLTLSFAPAESQDLTLVRNTGPRFIQGEFKNLAHGQIV